MPTAELQQAVAQLHQQVAEAGAARDREVRFKEVALAEMRNCLALQQPGKRARRARNADAEQDYSFALASVQLLVSAYEEAKAVSESSAGQLILETNDMLDQLSRPLGTAGFSEPVLHTGLKNLRNSCWLNSLLQCFHFSPHLCVGFLFLVLHPVRLRPPPPPPPVLLLVPTQLVPTQLLTHTLVIHTTCHHTTCPHTTCHHTTCHHTTCPTHNLSSHHLSSHNLSSYHLSSHNLSSHHLSSCTLVITPLVITQLVITQLVPHNLSSHQLVPTQLVITPLVITSTCHHTTCHHTTCHHTTCPHTTCPHTTCHHTTCHSHNLSSHHLSSHQLVITQLVPTPLVITPLVITPLGDIHPRFTWQAWHLATSIVTLRGRRGTHGTGLAPVARLGPS